MKITNLCSIIILIYIVCLLPVCTGAEEDRWKHYYTNPDGTEHYYDSKSVSRTSKSRIRTRKGYSQVWVVKVREKMVYNDPEYKLKESRILREFDCSKRMVRTLMISESYKDGSKRIVGKIHPWKNIDLEPFYEALYEIVCKS